MPTNRKSKIKNMFDLQKVYQKQLNRQDFKKLSEFIYTNFGIQIKDSKKIMLQSRLHKRLKALEINDFSEYVKFLFSPAGKDEIIHMIDVVSTNKTDFFREASHFDFITDKILPQMTNNRHLKIWSSACSSGEEVYTLAIMMEEFNLGIKNLNYNILGTDISTRILEKANNAIYPIKLIENIPLNLKRKYFLKSKDKKNVRVVPNLRKKTNFRRLNLMDTFYSVPHDFDIIFCRNVLIYFDRETQKTVIAKLLDRLKKGGFLFLGHSESIAGYNFDLNQLQTTIFQKK